MGLSALLWFLLLVIAPLRTAQGEVVNSFQTCRNFFKDGIPPEGFESRTNKSNLVNICQRYNNNYYFATLYRTDLRIPVYSAYIYQYPRDKNKARRCSIWFYEPQIDDKQATRNMEKCCKKNSDKQAVSEDYMNSSFERGHLYPFSFNVNNAAIASCTLTNAIPQLPEDNKSWYHYAEKIIKVMAESCHESGRTIHLVTGSAKYSNNKMKGKVVIPGMIWTAVCCTSSQNQNRPIPLEWENTGNPINFDFSIAFMKELVPGRPVVNVSVSQLEEQLRNLDPGTEPVTIFSRCPRTSENEQTVVQNFLNDLLAGRSWKSKGCNNRKRIRVPGNERP